MKGTSVNLFDYGRNKIIELAKYLNNDDKESFSLMNEFLNNLKNCDNIGDIEEAYAMVKEHMKKNSFLFLKREELLACCEDETDSELNKIIDEVISKLRTISVLEFETKSEEIIEEAKKKIAAKNVVLSCVAKSEKEAVYGRCEFIKRVDAKLLGVLMQYNRNDWYCYTMPFIRNELAKLREIDDLALLEREIEELRDKIEVQQGKDLIEAVKKKMALRSSFNKDFDDGVFPIEDKMIFARKISAIKTFGGFADFTNKYIKFELEKMLRDTEISLLSNRVLLGRSNDKISKKMVKCVDRAVRLLSKFSSAYEARKSFEEIIINSDLVVDYRKFAINLKKLKEIDFLNEEFEVIDSYLDEVEKFFEKKTVSLK